LRPCLHQKRALIKRLLINILLLIARALNRFLQRALFRPTAALGRRPYRRARNGVGVGVRGVDGGWGPLRPSFGRTQKTGQSPFRRTRRPRLASNRRRPLLRAAPSVSALKVYVSAAPLRRKFMRRVAGTVDEISLSSSRRWPTRAGAERRGNRPRWEF
jgi:hypothetical protein